MEEVHTKYSNEELLKSLPNFTSNYAEVNNTKLHYVKGGKGEPLILIPGYPETWWSYHKIMPTLAEKYCIIVVEMRGMGSSDKPLFGYDKKNMAKDIYELILQLGYEKVYIAGHDIGAHIAFSFASNFTQATSKLILLDTPHPDTGMYQLPMLPILGASYIYPWWLAFNQVEDIPEQLLEGRMEILIEWLYKKLLINYNSVSDFDKAVYAYAYNSKDAIRASNAWYQAFPIDIEDSKNYKKIAMPVLGIGGSGYEMLKISLESTTTDYKLHKIYECGHFILAEKPQQTVNIIMQFLGETKNQ
ncbi:alpha/beta hydrolase [Flavobacterium sp. Fl-77]|uniref:Alpha/beta hydrolase n=1 Tax=Flavobacterium flavipigmentatum TaxID=2893884 RepID=A0AAJ2SD64_9FLAO|nr:MULTISPECIES: alpha/beta hydrolase [unclassified Flavobacterium]MDX6182425.1 alpha/beta hydrolase [Flavobacterium sp. Fl-33]MDX6185662.1 alpha/beta hydrolase [Flavobacterium sp. Fl-77]UFH38847.1 alpha/beta hydrolase [Flavobacterium sp. F-70]